MAATRASIKATASAYSTRACEPRHSMVESLRGSMETSGLSKVIDHDSRWFRKLHADLRCRQPCHCGADLLDDAPVRAGACISRRAKKRAAMAEVVDAL